jgi:transcriptional regulator with XRE-family HTH domain
MARVKRPPHKRGIHFIRQWREFRQVTQEQLADMLEVDRTTVGKIENQKLPYNQDYLERVSAALGVDIEDLLSVDPLAPSRPTLVWSKIEKAPPDLQEKIRFVIEAMLKAG